MKMLLKTLAKPVSFGCGRALTSVRSSAHTKCMRLQNFSTTMSQSEKSYTEHLESLHRAGTRFGQPTQFTHPHMLKANELAIGILPSEFADRRGKFMEKIKEHCFQHNKPNRNIAIIPAAVKKYMTGKIPYFFRQNTDFFYLTGCLEPESILILWTNSENQTKSALFMRPKNSHDELWDGPRTGVEHAVEFFGVDEAHPLNDLAKFIERYVSQSKSANVWYDNIDEIQPNITTQVRQIVTSSTPLQSPMEFLHELRLIKSPAEADLMRKTCEIASKAINLTMQQTKPGDSEHYIHARTDFHCRMNDAQFLAYPPVVAAGNNANVIHYINNTQVAKDGELVLMDAGCEYGGYSSDITRTWPVNGKFTPAQEVLYEVVHIIQKELLNAVSSIENVTLDQLFDLMCYRLGKYLQEVGVITKSLSELESARQAAFKFCPHHVSHYLGMDIHDTPLIQRNRLLTPGMVFTIEPGLYIPADCKDVPQEFRGIGIRIEDDVLYTKNGVEVLTKDCIKEVSELKKILLT